jgi:hypothetical protein
MKIFLEDKREGGTGISCGINDNGELFLGNDRSGYNLPDTEENRDYIINDFYYYTGLKH